MSDEIEGNREFVRRFLDDSKTIISQLDPESFVEAASLIASTRKSGGRIFFAGSGGGAGHASHAACDFRKLASCEAYCVTDNVSELTARVNDDGWDTSYSRWLEASRVNRSDCLVIFSVGGGSVEPQISMNLVNAAISVRERGGSIIGILGRDGGEIGRIANVSIVVPPVNSATVTPQTEGFQSIIWHLLVSMPTITQFTAKWESVTTI